MKKSIILFSFLSLMFGLVSCDNNSSKVEFKEFNNEVTYEEFSRCINIIETKIKDKDFIYNESIVNNNEYFTKVNDKTTSNFKYDSKYAFKSEIDRSNEIIKKSSKSKGDGKGFNEHGDSSSSIRKDENKVFQKVNDTFYWLNVNKKTGYDTLAQMDFIIKDCMANLYLDLFHESYFKKYYVDGNVYTGLTSYETGYRKIQCVIEDNKITVCFRTFSKTLNMNKDKEQEYENIDNIKKYEINIKDLNLKQENIEEYKLS